MNIKQIIVVASLAIAAVAGMQNASAGGFVGDRINQVAPGVGTALDKANAGRGGALDMSRAPAGVLDFQGRLATEGKFQIPKWCLYAKVKGDACGNIPGVLLDETVKRRDTGFVRPKDWCLYATVEGEPCDNLADVHQRNPLLAKRPGDLSPWCLYGKYENDSCFGVRKKPLAESAIPRSDFRSKWLQSEIAEELWPACLYAKSGRGDCWDHVSRGNNGLDGVAARRELHAKSADAAEKSKEPAPPKPEKEKEPKTREELKKRACANKQNSDIDKAYCEAL